jgi:hypothetical protein
LIERALLARARPSDIASLDHPSAAAMSADNRMEFPVELDYLSTFQINLRLPTSANSIEKFSASSPVGAHRWFVFLFASQ